MKIEYIQNYVDRMDMALIMKATYDDNDEMINYELTGYYFGEPNDECLNIFKESLIKKEVL